MSKRNRTLAITPQPAHEQLGDWFMRLPIRCARAEEIALKLASITRQPVRRKDYGSQVSLTRFYLEAKYKSTLVFDRVQHLYRVVKAGSYEASRFTMSHYRRAVLAASRARELDQQGFLNPAHVDQVVREVTEKTSRRTKELSSLKVSLIASWKQLRTKERMALKHENPAKV